MLELYTNDLSPFARAVELQLVMKGVDYKRTVPDREYAINGDYGKLTPLRKIPLAVVEGQAIAESRVISDLIEEMYPTPSLLPDAPASRAQVRMLATIATLYLATPGVQIFANRRDKNSADIEADARALLTRGLAALDHWIAAGPYAAGEYRSVADCFIAPTLFFLDGIMPLMGVGDLPAFGAKTSAYYAAVREDADVAVCIDSMDSATRKRLAQA